MSKVMISIPEGLLSEIDQVAKAEHRKRSEFFKELAVSYLKKFRRTPQGEFSELVDAAASGLDFWDNPVDDDTWNDR